MSVEVRNDEYWDSIQPPDGNVRIDLTDSTSTGVQKWSVEQKVTASHLSGSAECIVERPTVHGSLPDLANFGSVYFPNCTGMVMTVTKGGKITHVIGEGLSTPYTLYGAKKQWDIMVDGNDQLMAVPTTNASDPNFPYGGFTDTFNRSD
jgi:hypothetical protein